MSNAFVKEETVKFEEMLEGFDDYLVLSRNVNKRSIAPGELERNSDVIWFPQPYIATSYDGSDATANFKAITQLSVPSAVNIQKHVPAVFKATELRDALQSDRFGEAAMQRLASDINVSLMNIAATRGTLVVKRTSAASGYDDVALAGSVMNEIGVMQGDRYLALSSRDYNSMAGNLASRDTVTGKVLTAYERARVGMVAGFDTYELDYANRLAAAAGGGGLTIDTLTTGNQYYTPAATSVGSAGEVGNVDNRYHTVTISSTTGVAAGDCFTIAGVHSVHHITKQSTGQLKTFRVISVDSSTTMTISPPIISNGGGTAAEAQYQNCVVTTASDTSAIVFLNTVAASVNPFWHRDAMEIIPGTLAVPANAGAAIITGTTPQGIQLTMQKQYDINTQQTFYRWDVRYGVNMVQPEMAGIILFSQS